ncbi:MAG: carbohydrate binding domain-containing protein [Fibrobacterales bacterium]
MKKIGFRALCLLLFTAVLAISAPIDGQQFNFKQPDGSLVPVKVWGDEFYQRVESIDGYTLIRDTDGWIVYADVAENGSDFVATNERYTVSEFKALRKAKKIHKNKKGKALRKRLKLDKKARRNKANKTRMENDIQFSASSVSGSSPVTQMAISPAGLSGNILGLTILVDFSDDEGTIPQSDVSDFLNLQGYSENNNNGSVNDFFWDISNGNVNYTNVVTAYYRAIHPKTYYDDPEKPYGSAARELILEALVHLRDVVGLEFSQFDSDNNNYIDAINLFYAGNRSSGWSKGLWPHRSSVSGFSADGVSSKDYQITDMKSYLTLGTFCHENGHMLFSWPDTYDYDYDSRGTGAFDLMSSSGSTNPKYPNPYFRHKEGWFSPQALTQDNQGDYSVTANNDADIFIYQNAARAQERYYIEARKKENRHLTMPGEGLLIWHIDEYGNNSANERWVNKHFRVSVVQADGLYQLENNQSSGGVNDFFFEGNNASFSAKTSPEARWWNGDYSELTISSVSQIADVMSFDFAVASPLNKITNGDYSQATTAWTLENAGDAAATFTVSGESATLSITNGGTEEWNVQFKQGAISLESGKQYRLAFTASSAGERTIAVQLETDGSPWTNYSKTTLFDTDYNKKTYVHDFIMDETDLNARIVFNVGGNSGNVYLDNVSLIELTEDESPILTSIEVDDLTLQVGTSAPLSYRGYDQNGNLMTIGQPAFSVNGGGTFSYSTFNAEEAGAWNLTMNYGGLTATAQITVENDGSATNMITNGNFNMGVTHWDADWAGTASGSTGTNSEGVVLGINDGGTEAWHVQFKQGAIPLESGKTYRMSFDARATAARTIDAALETDGSPWTNYSNTSPFALSTSMQHFVQEFTMNETDMNARIVFNVGNNNADVTIGNVVLIEVAEEPPVLTGIEVDPITVIVDNGASVQYRGIDQYGNSMSIGLPNFTTTGGGWFKYTQFSATEVGSFTMTMSYGGFEATASLTVLDDNPSVNLVTNGDFSNTTTSWVLDNYEGGSAYTSVTSEECSIVISQGGSSDWNVQFRQGGIPLESGKSYRFSFDARAATSRSITAHLETDGSPWTNYGSIPATSISETMSTYSYEFTMNQTDMNARIVFNLGVNSADVVIDNVVVEEI